MPHDGLFVEEGVKCVPRCVAVVRGSIPGLMRPRAEANKGCNIAGISVIDGQEVST